MKKHRFLIVYLVCYTLINLLLLTDFPFVHSDEPWLSGLSRNMLESGSLSVTEPFFNLLPRYPHAIKSLFHLLQMPFIAALGYNVFAVRLLSLLCGIAALWLFYLIVLDTTQKRTPALLGAILLSLNIQFLYASHFARQEIVVLLVMLAVYRVLQSDRKHPVLLAAVLTGVCVGIHPNSFLVAALAGGLLILRCIRQKRVLWRDIGVYMGVVAAFAACFVALSFSFDRDFIRHYIAFGSEFQVDTALPSKLREILPYFQRLYYRVSGTYYTPDIRLQLLLLPVLACAGATVAFLRKNTNLLAPVVGMLAILAGMTIVGRFSQPYVVFFTPFGCLLAVLLLQEIKLSGVLARSPAIALLCGCLVSAGLSLNQVLPVALSKTQYGGYLAQIASVVPRNAKTIGNLNAEYHFDNGALLDYRNLPFIKENGQTLQEYMEQNGVEYLIVSDELSFIYELRPMWNGIYGNINFLNELDELLQNHCTLLHTFVDNQYGVRIVRFQNTNRDFSVRIYRYNGAD